MLNQRLLFPPISRRKVLVAGTTKLMRCESLNHFCLFSTSQIWNKALKVLRIGNNCFNVSYIKVLFSYRYNIQRFCNFCDSCQNALLLILGPFNAQWVFLAGTTAISLNLNYLKLKTNSHMLDLNWKLPMQKTTQSPHQGTGSAREDNQYSHSLLPLQMQFGARLPTQCGFSSEILLQVGWGEVPVLDQGCFQQLPWRPYRKAALKIQEEVLLLKSYMWLHRTIFKLIDKLAIYR